MHILLGTINYTSIQWPLVCNWSTVPPKVTLKIQATVVLREGWFSVRGSWTKRHGSGGGFFPPAWENSGKGGGGFDNYSPPAFNFFMWRSACLHRLHSLCEGSVHSGKASWGDYGQALPDELHVSLFPSLGPWAKSLDSIVSLLLFRWTYDDDGFFLTCEDFAGMLDNHSPFMLF